MIKKKKKFVRITNDIWEIVLFYLATILNYGSSMNYLVETTTTTPATRYL